MTIKFYLLFTNFPNLRHSTVLNQENKIRYHSNPRRRGLLNPPPSPHTFSFSLSLTSVRDFSKSKVLIC